MPHARFVGYCRASTPRQILGLALQHDVIERYAAGAGGEIIACFEEAQRASPTAKGLAKHQPELARALAMCRATGATLIVARLDRLARSTALVALLLEEGPPLLVAETPRASRLMLHVYAALAEENRQRMGRRIRAGIAAAKAKGKKRNPHAQRIADQMWREARAKAEALRSTIEEIRRKRGLTIPQVAAELNRRGLRTAGGRAWGYRSTFTLWHRLHRKWDTRRFPGRPGSTDSEVALTRATEHAETLRLVVERLRRDGVMGEKAITKRLNAEGLRTVTGLPWHRNMTYRLLRRLDGKPV
jgi:DNA invertase Pin-like site-specific DNA recombinase